MTGEPDANRAGPLAGDPVDVATPPVGEASDRFAFPREELRSRTVRGVAINAMFLVALEGLVVVQGLIVSYLLGPELIGLYGIVTITVMTIITLKRIGIEEAFVQQSEAGQEEEFQRAFTLELGVSVLFAIGIVALAPVVAAVYGDDELVPLMAALSYLPIVFALQAPGWVYLRRMDFVRQRLLQAVIPVVTFVVTIPLALSGFGVWSLVVGPLAGGIAGAVVAIAVSPHRLRLRFDPATARRYISFSTPVLLVTVAMLIVDQGQILAFTLTDGLVGAGFITLAYTLTRYVDRADQIVIVTIYPAICAIQNQTRRLTELFVKSNRATLLFVLPFSAAVVLFAPDLINFVLGDEWEGAVGLVQGLAVAVGLAQVAANWFAFYRAHGDSWPTAWDALTGAGGLLALAIPGLIVWGTAGFIVGRVLGVLITLAVRRHYVRKLLPDVRLGRLVLLAVRPVAIAILAVVVLRLALWGGERDAAQAVVEVVVFCVLYPLCVLWLERTLLREIRAGWGQREAEPAPV